MTTLDPPAAWGVEREVSDLDDLLAVNFDVGNIVEWYFVDGRVSLVFQYGRDSSALGDESLLTWTCSARRRTRRSPSSPTGSQGLARR